MTPEELKRELNLLYGGDTSKQSHTLDGGIVTSVSSGQIIAHITEVANHNESVATPIERKKSKHKGKRRRRNVIKY